VRPEGRRHHPYNTRPLSGRCAPRRCAPYCGGRSRRRTARANRTLRLDPQPLTRFGAALRHTTDTSDGLASLDCVTCLIHAESPTALASSVPVVRLRAGRVGQGRRGKEIRLFASAYRCEKSYLFPPVSSPATAGLRQHQRPAYCSSMLKVFIPERRVVLNPEDAGVP
jgi:hypothetical protein